MQAASSFVNCGLNPKPSFAKKPLRAEIVDREVHEELGAVVVVGIESLSFREGFCLTSNGGRLNRQLPRRHRPGPPCHDRAPAGARWLTHFQQAFEITH
jgi:hypothetical protein